MPTAPTSIFIDDTARRYKGAFWTPPIWAARARELLDDWLGIDWSEKYHVWDPACGTKNLTAGYSFHQLYSSTLVEKELVFSQGINPDQTAFQFDFLNDSLDALPPQLRRDLENKKPFLFFLNPPYGTATNSDETSKAGIARSAVNRHMAKARMNRAAHQLYAQFLWRILSIKRHYELDNVSIALFSSDRFLCGGVTWESFITEFERDFTFSHGIYLPASEFEDLSDKWGLAFTLWRSHPSTACIEQSDHTFSQIVDTTPTYSLYLERSVPGTDRKKTRHIQRFGRRIIHRRPQKDFMSTWIREPVKSCDKYEPDDSYPRLSNAFEVNTSKSGQTKLLYSAIGYAHTNANDIEHSGKEVGLYSTAFGSGHGVSVTAENFERVCVNFAVRKAVFNPRNLWIYGHENFIRPTASLEQSKPWKAFVYDCVVASLASTSGSHQSSLRAVIYRGQPYDVVNQWFFSSQDTIVRLAQKAGFTALIDDVKQYGSYNRFVYDFLATATQASPGQSLTDAALDCEFFSENAIAVLSELEELLEKTMPLRRDLWRAACDDYSLQRAEQRKIPLHRRKSVSMQAWDAGFRQLMIAARVGGIESSQLIAGHKSLMESISKQAQHWGLICDIEKF